MAFVERKLLPELRRNHNRRRNPPTPTSGPAKPSLDKCIYLATTDKKSLPKESLHDLLARKTEGARKLAAKKHMHGVLQETLKGVALQHKDEDLRAAWDGSENDSKGPWSAARDYRRLENCQKEWIGFKATCCNSRAVAVPIGCNHRLCPLCNAARLEHYRGPAREMLAAMENPTFLTLTVPNVNTLKRETFDQLRRWWKEFLRLNSSIVRGGIYSIEVTYNRHHANWHPHMHIVFDAPWRTSGMARAAFLQLKRLLEFSWLRITSKEARRTFRANELDRWIKESVKHMPGSDWNKRYRRVVDVRPVEGEDAVYELIKYVSKTNTFIDLPEAVATFLRAIHGVRVMQSFGTYYNFNSKFKKAEVPLSAEDISALKDAGIDIEAPATGAASFLRCDCGANKFERIGVFSMRHVEMDEDGRWLIKKPHEPPRCRGSSTNPSELGNVNRMKTL